jgi:NAD(P)-dependent dehydrogenase (short-subunit alcohol dehydrogenase family)
MSADLSNSTALITGATSGIGRATAVQLAALGAHVIVSGRDKSRGDAVVAGIHADGGTADFVPAELSDENSVRELASRAIKVGGGHVDILVNNGGVFPFGATADTPATQIDEVYAVNVKAPYLLVASLAPAMAERGHGSIINISTMVADFGMNGMGLYGSSKAALVLLTKAWAAEFGPAGVRVNAVSPGPTRTEGTVGMGEALDQLAATAPAGRVGKPEEIAAAIAFLATDQASFIHGVMLPADGGASRSDPLAPLVRVDTRWPARPPAAHTDCGRPSKSAG